MLSTLQKVGELKITPYSYPLLEGDIGKILCPLFPFQTLATLIKMACEEKCFNIMCSFLEDLSVIIEVAYYKEIHSAKVKSTAVEQVVACALVTQRARVQSPVGTSFLGEVFPHL